jgi:uncharacterized protein (UPF0147 family)
MPTKSLNLVVGDQSVPPNVRGIESPREKNIIDEEVKKSLKLTTLLKSLKNV